MITEKEMIDCLGKGVIIIFKDDEPIYFKSYEFKDREILIGYDQEGLRRSVHRKDIKFILPNKV